MQMAVLRSKLAQCIKAKRVAGGEQQQVVSSNKVMSNKMWGGRFRTSPDAVMEDINSCA